MSFPLRRLLIVEERMRSSECLVSERKSIRNKNLCISYLSWNVAYTFLSLLFLHCRSFCCLRRQRERGYPRPGRVNGNLLTQVYLEG